MPVNELDRDTETISAYRWASIHAPDVRRAKARWPIAIEALRDISRQITDFVCFCEPPDYGDNPCLVCVIGHIIDMASKGPDAK